MDSSIQLSLLPVEIWQHIFLLASSFSNYSLIIDEEEQPFVRAPLIALSGVCSRWREIILRYPELWATVDVRLGALSWTALKVLDTFLSRSREVPLTMIIRNVERICQSHCLPHGDDVVAWESLSSHFHRCSELVLDTEANPIIDPPDDSPFGSPFEENEFTFPILTTFKGEYYVSDECSILHLKLCQALAEAPRLTALSTLIPHTITDFPDEHGQRLTSLTFRELISDDEFIRALNVLPFCRKLEYLAFHRFPASSTLGDINTTIHLPTLRTLVVGDPTAGHSIDPTRIHARIVFRSLSLLPSLRTLEVFFGFWDKFEWSRAFLSLLVGAGGGASNFSSLTEVYIGLSQHSTIGLEWQQLLLLPVLERLPNLHVFDVVIKNRNGYYKHSNTPILLDLFTDCLSQQKLVPKLTSLTVRVSHIDPLPNFIGSMIKVADARRPGKWVSGPGLRTIHLIHILASHPFPQGSWELPVVGNKKVNFGDSVVQRIEELKKEGVKVVVETMGP